MAGTQRASILTADTYSRAIRASILAPDAVRGTRESPGRNFNHHFQDPVGYQQRMRSRPSLGNDFMPNAEGYQEYFEQDEHENDAEPSHLVVGASAVIPLPANTFAPTAQRPGVQQQRRQSNYGPVSLHPIQHQHGHLPMDPSMNSVHPLVRPDLSDHAQHSLYQLGQNMSITPTEYEDPFRDVPAHHSQTPPHIHPHSQNHVSVQRHSVHTSTRKHSMPPISSNRHRSLVSEYRRPHSFAVGSGGQETEEGRISFRTHVLDENEEESE
ncbi:hypothetical protein BGX26_007279, partial [Mortierella sp. AD094]